MTKELRVFGPPGTGKTTFLSKQISLAASKYGSDAVMAASFTKAAAVELVSRELPVSKENVGTLHALCYRALGMPKIAETKIREFNESQSIYRLSGGSVDIDEPEQSYDTESDALFAQYQIYRSRIIPRDMWAVDVQAFAKKWDGWKYESEYIDFTDMIELAIKRNIAPPHGTRVGFFDESQDFTKLELKLVRMWGEQLEYIVVAGDDDQAIFGFKGSDAEAFLNPPLPEDQVRILEQSYRLPLMIHTYSAQWIDQVVNRQPKWFRSREGSDGQVVNRKDLFFKNPERIVDVVQEFQDIDPSQSTMIVGACSYQLRPLVDELKRRGLLFHNPYRTKRGDWNPLGNTAGLSTPKRLESLLRHPWSYGDIRAWSALVARTGVFSRGAYERIVVGPSADDYPSETAREQLFSYGVEKQIRNNPLGWVMEHATTQKKSVLEYPVQIIQKHGIEKLHEKPGIIVGTIHSVKGGEADSVILLPDLSPAGMRQYASDRERQHIIRQFYVGMTRAKERLILCNQSSPMSVRWGEIS